MRHIARAHVGSSQLLLHARAVWHQPSGLLELRDGALQIVGQESSASLGVGLLSRRHRLHHVGGWRIRDRDVRVGRMRPEGSRLASDVEMGRALHVSIAGVGDSRVPDPVARVPRLARLARSSRTGVGARVAGVDRRMAELGGAVRGSRRRARPSLAAGADGEEERRDACGEQAQGEPAQP